MKKSKRKLKKIEKILLICAMIIFIGIIIFSGYKIIRYKIDQSQIKEQDKSFSEVVVKTNDENAEAVNPPVDPKKERMKDYWEYMKIPLMEVDFGELLTTNKDTVGWLNVNGTNINYPVVQTNNNTYYLTHAFNKKGNYAGWVFADYRNDMIGFDKNTIIYGHGRVDQTMFGSLKKIVKSSWYKDTDNYIVQLSTPTKNTLWQVFSVYHVPTESYYITTDFASDEEFLNFATTMKERSVYKFEAEVDNNDKILTLSTCWNSKERVVLHAKLIKMSER